MHRFDRSSGAKVRFVHNKLELQETVWSHFSAVHIYLSCSASCCNTVLLWGNFVWLPISTGVSGWLNINLRVNLSFKICFVTCCKLIHSPLFKIVLVQTKNMQVEQVKPPLISCVYFHWWVNSTYQIKVESVPFFLKKNIFLPRTSSETLSRLSTGDANPQFWDPPLTNSWVDQVWDPPRARSVQLEPEEAHMWPGLTPGCGRDSTRTSSVGVRESHMGTWTLVESQEDVKFDKFKDKCND